MWSFLVDEDMQRSTAVALRDAGFAADDVRDVGLRGMSDDLIFARAQGAVAILITEDLDFANTLSFPLGTHAGLIVVRVPNELPSQRVNDEILRALRDLEGTNLRGALIIVEVGRTRMRRPPSP